MGGAPRCTGGASSATRSSSLSVPPRGGSPDGGTTPAAAPPTSTNVITATAAAASAASRGTRRSPRFTASLPETHVNVVEVAAGGVADVVDTAAGVAPAPSAVVLDARVPVAALPDQVLHP